MRKILIPIILPLLFACKQAVKEEYISTTNLEKIYFASSGCLGECPIMQIELSKELNYNFNGIMYTQNKGFYTGVITEPEFSGVRKYLDSSIIIPIDVREKSFHIADAQHNKLILFMDDGKIYNSDSLYINYDVYQILMNSYKYIKLEKVDTIKFYESPIM